MLLNRNVVENLRDFHFLVNSLFNNKQTKKLDAKHMYLFIWFLIATFLFIVVTIVHAQSEIIKNKEENKVGDYYQNSKRGYWWYEDPPKKEEKQEKKEKKEEIVFIPSLQDYSYNQLMNMHPDEFKPLMAAFLKKAVQHPTEDNVREYYIIQDIARRKALAFANAASYVIQKYPDFNVSKDDPLSAPGRNALTRMISNEVKSTIEGAANDFALLYFYSPDCPFCEEQDGILRYFRLKYNNLEVRKINRDTNQALAASVGVNIVPSIVLIYRGSLDSIPVSVGVASVSELEERIYRGIKMLRGEKEIENWSLYDFQKGISVFDVKSGEKVYNDYIKEKSNRRR